MRFNIFVKSTLNITTMNSKRKDLQYASVFLLAVALTFLMGKGDNLWLVSWGDLIPSLFVLFIAGDCLHSSLLRIKAVKKWGSSLEYLFHFSGIQYRLYGRFILYREFYC